MPPIGPTLPLGVDRPGAGDELAAGEIGRADLIDDSQREHHSGRRTADLVGQTRDRPRTARCSPGRPRFPSGRRSARWRGAMSGTVTVSCVPSRLTTTVASVPGVSLAELRGQLVGRRHRRAVDRDQLVVGLQYALGLRPGGERLDGDALGVAELTERGRLGEVLRVDEVLRVLLVDLLLGLAGRIDRVARDDHLVVGEPALRGPGRRRSRAVLTSTVVRFRWPVDVRVSWPLITMISLPWSSLPSVFSVGPGLRIT